MLSCKTLASATSIEFRMENPSGITAILQVILIDLDLPPANRTIRSWNFPFMIPLPGAGEFHEDVEVHGRADRLCVEAG